VELGAFFSPPPSSGALAGLRPGEIILMHAGANPTDDSTLDAHALPTIISRIRQRGYKFVALPQAYASRYPSWAHLAGCCVGRFYAPRMPPRSSGRG
jgi:hypothetical protein